MSPATKGTIHVNIHELEILLKHLKKLRDILDDQRCHIRTLQKQVHSAITGTAPHISKFDQRFDHWMKLLDTVTRDIDIAYQILSIVLEEAHEGDIAGVLKALGEGCKKH